MTERDTRVPDILWERGAFLDKHHGQGLLNWVPGKGFKLKLHDTKPDAPLSPIFVNIRTPDNPGKSGNLTPADLETFGEVQADFLEKARLFAPFDDFVAHFDELAGIPEAGVPIVLALQAAFARRGYHFPLYPFRKDSSGGGRRIVAPIPNTFEGRRLLLVDDLITKAGTKLETVEAGRSANFRISDLLVLVDREQGGEAELVKAGVQLHAIWPITAMLDYYVSSKRMSREDSAEINRYLTENG